ncbi:MAG: acetyl-CoA carboxylase biotin carboxyl carrier protein [Chitinophagales bacterium]
MDIKQIQELVKLVTKSGISELSVKDGDMEVTVKNGVSGPVAHPIQGFMSPQLPVQQAVVAAPAATTETKTSETPATTATDANTYTFKSPMIGTFYRKPSPDKDVFVKVGDTVKKGDVLCIIEAMKLFNEIEFDGDSGKVVKILADDISPVEYDQPLFLIEKA